MTPRQLILLTAEKFREAGVPDPVYDSSLLLSSLCGKPALSLRLDDQTELSPALLRTYEELSLRRQHREPLQYMLAESIFCGLSFYVDPNVLIPRPETELLCEWALELISGLAAPRVLDVCAGSGCIGLTVKAKYPRAEVILSDISPEALKVAAVNASRLKLEVRFLHSDLLEQLTETDFDLIISNPPYIPSADCPLLQAEVLQEPRLALDGGADGLDFYRRLSAEAPEYLKPEGKLLVEIGEGQADQVVSLMTDAGFHACAVREDYAGIRRMVCGTRPDQKGAEAHCSTDYQN